MEITSKLFQSKVFHSDRIRRFLPTGIKTLLKRQISYADYRSEQLRREAEHMLGGPVPLESDYDSPHTPVFGIFFDNGYTFAFNVAACRDLKVRFKVIDILASDWLHRVADSGCDAFLAAPDTLRGIWRRAYEERLWVVAHDLKKRLCPTFDELYLWESKRRMRDWLVAHDVPHPETWVFFDRKQAMSFCQNTEYPVVAKTDSGATAAGIFVLRDRYAAERLVSLAFGKGILTRFADAREREQGSILFQRYIPHEHEWRIVRIGNDFMCRRKVRIGDYASGSGDIGWAEPLPGMLDFAYQITKAGNFHSMAIDLFENPDPENGPPYLVNELQTLFGPIVRESNVNGHAGRWHFTPDNPIWQFEPGFFYQNACANLRVSMLSRDILSEEVRSLN